MSISRPVKCIFESIYDEKIKLLKIKSIFPSYILSKIHFTGLLIDISLTIKFFNQGTFSNLELWRMQQQLQIGNWKFGPRAKVVLEPNWVWDQISSADRGIGFQNFRSIAIEWIVAWLYSAFRCRNENKWWFGSNWKKLFSLLFLNQK